MRKARGVKKWDYLHFFPAIIHLLDLLPFYGMGYEEKQKIAQAIFEHNKLLFFIGGGIIPISLHYVFRLIIYFVYYVLAFRLIKYYNKKSGLPLKKNWLFVSFLLTGCVLVGYTIFTYGQMLNLAFEKDYILFAGAGICLLGVLTLCVYVNFYMETVFGIPFSSSQNTSKSSHLKFKGTQTNYEWEEEKVDKVLVALQTEMKAEIYLDNGLSLQRFAKKLSVSERLLSYTINHTYGEGFVEFINKQRIEFAKKKIEEGVLENQTIEQLANLCGFNSRITFFKAFKKFTGTSPTQFHEQNDHV
ncbi:helix-turn-helix domain-containing protein [Echinicola marina]|uniref:helix-turn-helix domain-containing protein n=1 Tax=Echinicola marina TaxID=2859768 RepID=UPI001CF693DA|nr:AraC family transcriptional regulator [Echinicola marina]UCS93969.1 helix-turn-helix domain-containing protein [Echinicola marina]